MLHHKSLHQPSLLRIILLYLRCDGCWPVLSYLGGNCDGLNSSILSCSVFASAFAAIITIAAASASPAAVAAAFRHRTGSASWSGVNAAKIAPEAAAMEGFAAD